MKSLNYTRLKRGVLMPNDVNDVDKRRICKVLLLKQEKSRKDGLSSLFSLSFICESKLSFVT